MSPAQSQDEVRDRQQTCLDLFVLRARRVQAHSLAADRDQIVRWAQHDMTIRRHASGRTWLVHQMPPEELLESAAARLRPFILQRDPIHYGKVLTAVGYLLSDEDRATAAPTLDGLRKSWNKVASPSDEVRAYSVHVTQAGGETSVMNADRLAFAWIYGDTIHADPIHQAGAEIFGIQERFRAATGIVAGLIINTIATLNFVLALHEGGRLSITGSVLDRDVVVEATDYRQEVQFYLGEPDAEPPLRFDEPLGAQWTPIGELADFTGLTEETPVTTPTHHDELTGTNNAPTPSEQTSADTAESDSAGEGASKPFSYTQSDDIVDHVFPLFNVELEEAGLRLTEFLGTGFFVGSHGHALTAKHVIKNAKTAAILMRDASRTGWQAFAVRETNRIPQRTSPSSASRTRGTAAGAQSSPYPTSTRDRRCPTSCSDTPTRRCANSSRTALHGYPPT